MLAASTTLDVTQPVHTNSTRIPGRNGGSLAPFTSDTARQVQLRRWEAYRAAAARAVADGTSAANSRDGWRLIIARQAEAALSGGRGSTQAAALVGRAIGALDVVRQQAEVSETSLPAELRLVVGLVRERAASTPALAERLAQLARGDTIHE